MPTTINGNDITVPGNANLTTLVLPVTLTGISYAVLATDELILLTATGLTATLPDATQNKGKRFTIKLTASGTGTVATTSSQDIDAATTYSLSAQYKFVTVLSDGVQWWITSAN